VNLASLTAGSITSIDHLEDLLSTPTPLVIDVMRQTPGDLIVLGVAGKMGPTLARMAKRASDAAGVPRRIIGVARFSSQEAADNLAQHDIEAIRCDLLDAAALAALPDAPNVVFMAGRKFGSTGHESLTWAMNVHVPALVAQRYASSRIVAFSTGNVYGLTPVGHGGSVETDLPQPVGEYAMSCLGRERMFEYFSVTNGTPMALLRLNYATELRYGVLVDLASRLSRGDVIDVTMGHVNVLWQADANAMALAALAHASTPPFIVNLAGPEELSVRETCQSLGQAMGVPVRFTGEEARDALLSNGSLGHARLGAPTVTAAHLIAWTADWVKRGGATLDKPTHFESRDGGF
jgi:nucleoside-diphosphate-sugar epimerase